MATQKVPRRAHAAAIEDLIAALAPASQQIPAPNSVTGLETDDDEGPT